MIVWVVHVDGYLGGVFSTEEKAEQYSKLFPTSEVTITWQKVNKPIMQPFQRN